MDPLEWNEAQHKARIIQEEKKIKTLREQLEQAENMKLAKDELWDAMGSDGFRHSHFEDICSSYDVDEEDLLFSLI